MPPSTEDDFDPRFSLPAIDAPAGTEIGVILMGLDTERLLAGLGAAGALDDDAATVTLRVDQIRHGARPDRALADLVAEGARRWRSARPALYAADPEGPPRDALRPLWTYGARVAAGVDLPSEAARCYLAACWLRRAAVDQYLEETHAVPAIDA